LVIERANRCCEYCRCQQRFAVQAFSVEHIIPRRRRGKSIASNLAFACQGCNNHKYAKTHAYDPITGVWTPLFHPRRDRWDEHFAWDENFALILGLTSIGRATAHAMQLNRDGLVNLSKILFEAGEHLPTF
jgi:hypothetical protein